MLRTWPKIPLRSWPGNFPLVLQRFSADHNRTGQLVKKTSEWFNDGVTLTFWIPKEKTAFTTTRLPLTCSRLQKVKSVFILCLWRKYSKENQIWATSFLPSHNTYLVFSWVEKIHPQWRRMPFDILPARVFIWLGECGFISFGKKISLIVCTCMLCIISGIIGFPAGEPLKLSWSVHKNYHNDREGEQFRLLSCCSSVRQHVGRGSPSDFVPRYIWWAVLLTFQSRYCQISSRYSLTTLNWTLASQLFSSPCTFPFSTSVENPFAFWFMTFYQISGLSSFPAF